MRDASTPVQTGNVEICINDADGGIRTQLTHLGGPRVYRMRWYTDGKTILFGYVERRLW